MATQEILRLRRTDTRHEHLLVVVSHKGPKGLDLELVGTDREAVFEASIKESAIETLQAANYNGEVNEWMSVLSHVLLHQKPEGPLPESLQGVEALATVSGSTVTITLRRNISGIAQKLGTIKLEKTEDREIDTLEWVDVAAKAAEDLRALLGSLQESLALSEDQVAKLSARIDSLVRAKKEHEDDLLSKFAAILNAKKLKIRDQQRLLAGAQVDPNAAEHGQQGTSPRVRPAGRDAAPSRKGKRKANGHPESVEDEEDIAQDQYDEQTDPGTVDEEDDDRRRQLTPETEEEDAVDEEMDAVPDASVMAVQIEDSQTTRRMATRHNQPVSSQMKTDDAGLSKSREVPVGRAKQVGRQPTPPPTSTANNEDDDDETDDEL